MNVKVLSALQRVLSHYYHDEEKDYESCGGDAVNHVFIAIRLLNRWLTELESSKRSAELLPTPFDDYEIHGVKEFRTAGHKWFEQVGDPEAEFWSLFGHIPGQGLDCIGDFKTRQLAEEIYARITRRRYSGHGV
jgi:hypothetical protein